MEDILVHQTNPSSPLYTQLLALMKNPEYPTPVGILRKVEATAYEADVSSQLAAAQAKRGTGNLQDLLYTEDCWTVD